MTAHLLSKEEREKLSVEADSLDDARRRYFKQALHRALSTIDTLQGDLEAAEAEVERARMLLTEDLSVLRMGPSEKGFTLETAGRMVSIIAGELATWLREHEAKNYTETTFEQIEVSGGTDRYIVTVQRASGKTPHQLRQEAEADRAALLEVVRAIHMIANFGLDARQCMMTARQALSALPSHLKDEAAP